MNEYAKLFQDAAAVNAKLAMKRRDEGNLTAAVEAQFDAYYFALRAQAELTALIY